MDRFTIHMGALSCMRHRGEEFTALQRQGKMAFLIMDEIDFITGSYIEDLKRAAHEVCLEHRPQELYIACGCQATLLSTDFDMLERELADELGIPVIIDRKCHLAGFHGRPGGRGDRPHGDRQHRRYHGERGERRGWRT